MKWKTALTAVLWTAIGSAARAEESLQERLERLEQKQAVLERKYEVDQESAAGKTGETLAGGAVKDGFALKSADGSFQLKLTGVVQTDARFLLSDEPRAFTDTFSLAKVRPSVEGTVQKHVDFRIVPEFAGTASVQDAYFDLKHFPAVRLRLGKFKVPFALERLQGDPVLLFVERGFPAVLTPNRDVGFQLFGELWNGALAWQAGLFNGATDGGSADTDTTDDKEAVGRLFVLPVKDLGLGAAYSRGTVQGTPTAAALPSYRTNGQQTFFAYRTDVLADGARTRFSPQAYWYPGSWSFLGEYVASSQEVKRGTTTFASTTFDELTHAAWQVAVAYVLTGEKSSYKGLKPKKSFDPKAGTWGALELAARYSELTLDEDAFTRYADPATAPRSARLLSGGVNWHLNANVKVAVNYDYTRFTRGAAAGDRDDERLLVTRFQLTY